MNQSGGHFILVCGALVCWTVFAFGCAVIAPKGEYAAYKAMRVAKGEDARLRAGRHYLDGFASGMWASVITAELAQREVPLFEKRGAERGGLELYLEVYPDGVFAEQASARLVAIESVSQRRQVEEAREASVADNSKRQAEQLRRTWMGRFAGEWLVLFSGLEGWGKGLAAVADGSPEFSRVFGRAPKPRCTRDACLKFYTATYSVPVPGATRLERTAQLLVRLRMVAGKLNRAEILLPGWGFSRWAEMEQRTLVLDNDPEQRAAAVSWARGELIRRLAILKGFESTGQMGGSDIQALMSSWSPPTVSPSGELIDPGAAHLDEVTPVLGGGAVEMLRYGRATAQPATMPKQIEAADMSLPLLRILPNGAVQIATREDVSKEASAAEPELVAGEARITALNQARPLRQDAAWQAETFRAGGLKITLFSAPVAVYGGGAGSDVDGLLIEPVVSD